MGFYEGVEKPLPQSVDDPRVVDTAPLMKDLGSWELVQLVYGSFESDTDGRLQRISDAIDTGQTEVVVREAHGIKGGARNFRALLVEEAAQNLETAARESAHIERQLQLLQALRKQCDVLRERMTNSGDGS